MKVLVSDTSVLIDLHRGALIPAVFGLPVTFVVPDLLYEHEIKGQPDLDFAGNGIEVMELDGPGVELAQRYQKATSRISRPDSFALALAKTHGYTLLAGDGALRKLAVTEHITCHGVLWVIDQMELKSIASAAKLHQALLLIRENKRCRLPPAELTLRINRLAGLL